MVFDRHPVGSSLLSQDGFATWSNGDYDTSYPVRVHAYADDDVEQDEKFYIQFRLAQLRSSQHPDGPGIDCSSPVGSEFLVSFKDDSLDLLNTSRDYLKTITIENSGNAPELTLFALHDDEVNEYDWPILLNDSEARARG